MKIFFEVGQMHKYLKSIQLSKKNLKNLTNSLCLSVLRFEPPSPTSKIICRSVLYLSLAPVAVLYVYHFGCRAFIIIMGVIQQIMLQIFFTLIEEGKKAQLRHVQMHTQSGSWYIIFV